MRTSFQRGEGEERRRREACRGCIYTGKIKQKVKILSGEKGLSEMVSQPCNFFLPPPSTSLPFFLSNHLFHFRDMSKIIFIQRRQNPFLQFPKRLQQNHVNFINSPLHFFYLDLEKGWESLSFSFCQQMTSSILFRKDQSAGSSFYYMCRKVQKDRFRWSQFSQDFLKSTLTS